MRIREMGYQDYGFDEAGERKESEKIMEYCRAPDFIYRKELIESAERANKSIADDIYYSIVKDLSYDDLVVKSDIPYSKTDFYAYRRKCLFFFRDMMRLYGKWN